MELKPITAMFLATLFLIGQGYSQETLESTGATNDRPNVIVLYSDDAGYADFGFQPGCAKDMRNLTPHIDSIARDGARLSNAYMSGCVCSPSRAGLMTSRYQGRFGFDNNLPPGFKSGLNLEETFCVKRLAAHGYATGLVGKWHLGYPEAYHPNRRGFDWFYGLLQGSRKYFPIENVSPHRVILENSTPTPEKGYVTDRFGDAAVRFIKQNRQQPFFLFVSFTAPHGPNQPKTKDLERVEHIKNKRRRNFAGLVVALDDNVGKILQTIKDVGIEENTIVLFTNDNGGQTKTGANNGKLRGRKGMLWEGGIRVPWAIRWPAKIKSGRVIDDAVISLDIFPTIFELAGMDNNDDWKLDGRSFLHLLTGQEESLPHRTLYWRKAGSNGDIALREGNWKLIHRRSVDDSRPELYDLKADPGETTDVGGDHVELVNQLVQKLQRWEQQLIQPRWGPGSKPQKTKWQADKWN